MKNTTRNGILSEVLVLVWAIVNPITIIWYVIEYKLNTGIFKWIFSENNFVILRMAMNQYSTDTGTIITDRLALYIKILWHTHWKSKCYIERKKNGHKYNQSSSKLSDSTLFTISLLP